MGLLDDEESRRKLMIDADGYRHRGLIDDAQQMSVGATAQTQLPAINVPPEKSGFSKTIGAIGTGLKYALPAFGMIYDQAKRGADDRAEVARMNEGAKQVNGGYEALAEYWAKQGNPEKAKQYMGLANPVLERSNSALSSRVAVNPATGKPELVILMRDGSTQFTGIEPTAKEKSDAGYTEEGLPLTETKPGKLPVGYFWNPITNSAERIPGLPIKPEQQPAATKAGGSASPKPAVGAGVAKPEKQTVDIRTAKGFLGRMQNTESIIDTMGESAYPTLTTSGIAAIPLIGDFLNRTSRTPEQQKYHNASMEWVRAKLRKESGAVIGPQEAIDEYNTYFPVYGDSPDVIRQKKILRAEAIRSMQMMAGETDSPAPRPSAPGKRKVYNPKTGRIE